MVLGLRVKRMDTGEEYDVWGYAYWKYIEGEKYYYCAGRSFPAGIVIKEYTTVLTAEELYHLAQTK